MALGTFYEKYIKLLVLRNKDFKLSLYQKRLHNQCFISLIQSLQSFMGTKVTKQTNLSFSLYLFIRCKIIGQGLDILISYKSHS